MSVSENDYEAEEEICDFDDNHYHQQQHPQLPHTLSRLSICTSRSDYSMCDINTEDGAGADKKDYLDMIRMYMSRVSMEGSVVDADNDDEDRQSYNNDNEVTSEKEDVEGVVISSVLSMSNSGEYDEPGCYSLPVTPKQRSATLGGSGMFLPALNYDVIVRPIDVAKLYASENEADLRKDGGLKRASKKNRRNSRRRILREKWLQRAWEMKKKKDRVVYDDDKNYYNEDYNRYGHSFGSGGEFGNEEHYRHQLMVITRPCGGGRSLCMDFEEVKACRDLGFELEQESTTFEFSSRHSMNSGRGGSTMDTSSAGSDGTSTVTNWRISSPGDDPKDVKARLKVWAQAVALASASQSRLLS